MSLFKKFLVLTFFIMIISIGGVWGSDSFSKNVANYNGDNSNLGVMSSDVSNNVVNTKESCCSLSSIEVKDLVDSGSNNDCNISGSVGSSSISSISSNEYMNNRDPSYVGSKIHNISPSNYLDYFDELGYVNRSKVYSGDILDFSGNFGVKDDNLDFIFSFPVTVTSTKSDAYFKDCSIIFEDFAANKTNPAVASNLKFNNTLTSGLNGVCCRNVSYVIIKNNNIYTESASGNPVRLIFSNYVDVLNNTLKTYYESTPTGFNASWLHSCIILGESHHNYIANNDVTVKESNPIYLSAYSIGPSNYNVIVNNTVRSNSVHKKTGLPNPSSWTYGIQLMGSYNKAINNTIYNVYRGVSSEGDYNEVIGNVIFNVTGGFYEGNNGTEGGEAGIYGSLGTLVANNTICDSKVSFGIGVGTNSTVYKNSISVSGYGIQLATVSSNLIIYDNIINISGSVGNINGIYGIGEYNNLTFKSNVIFSEFGWGMLIKNKTSSKGSKNLIIVDNVFYTNNKFINVSDSNAIKNNNTFNNISIVNSSNLANYFDEKGNLKNLVINGYLVFKGLFNDLKINNKTIGQLNITKPCNILGSDSNISNIKIIISSNNVTIENLHLEIENKSAVYLENITNFTFINSNIIVNGTNNSGLYALEINGSSSVNISSNNIQSKNSYPAIIIYNSDEINNSFKIFISNNIINTAGICTINLTNSGGETEELKNIIFNNYLIANNNSISIIGDSTVSFVEGCENYNNILDNNKIVTNLIILNQPVFVNSNPILEIALVDLYGNLIKNSSAQVNISNDTNCSTFNVVSDNKGIISIYCSLALGTYNISAFFNGTEIYGPSSLYTSFNVVRRDTSISIGNNSYYCGVNTVVEIYLKYEDGLFNLNGKKVTLTVYNNGKLVATYTNKTINGLALFNLANLSNSNYTFNYVFDNESEFNGSNGTLNVYVKKMPTSLNANNLVMFYADGSKLTVTLVDVNGNVVANKNISIIINSKTYKKTTDKSGKISLAIGSLVPKYYTGTIKFLGDSNFVNSTKVVKIQVKTRVTKIVASNLVKYYGDSKTLVAYLKDTNDKPVASKVVYITINSKTYKKTTDSKGKVSLAITLPCKTYAATIKFSAQYHTSSSKKVSVKVVKPTIKAISPYVKKGKKLSIVFKDIKGKAIQHERVYFKFKGQTYNVYTNDKGMGTLTCNIPKASYYIVAGFKSPAKYGKTTANIKFKVY